MTDEARTERLTQLARRVWPDTRVITWPEHVYVEDETPVQRASVFGHPRALEALEAALRVLDGQSAADDVVTLAEKLFGGPLRARMMALASEWEARAKERTRETAEKFGPAAAIMGPVLESLVQGMAQELRVRARQP